ncbi:MAG: GspMb/PilO family protein [Nitrospiraceae bacterium]|nr:GspMb/PilO family protein [Nitrospiraceae bacterium]
MNRRYLILGLALAVTVAAFDRYFVVPRAAALEDSVAVAYRGLQKDERFVRGPAGTGKDITAATEDLRKLEGGLIPEKTEFLASVRLQDDVSGMAGKAGLRIATTRTLPAADLGGYLSIPIYYEGSGDIKRLSDFFRALESGPLLVRVDRLTIGVTNMQNPKELKFKMQVSGVARR